jgi:hypothetical protein
MKTQLMILSVLAISATACGQKVSEADVPQPVKTAFMKQFPNAEHARWEMETMTEFEVNFKQGAEAMSATYGTAGQWMETEKDIEMEALPEAVRNTIASKYQDQKLEGISHVESPKASSMRWTWKRRNVHGRVFLPTMAGDQGKGGGTGQRRGERLRFQHTD